MLDIGTYFKAPRKTDKKAWARAEKLAQQGIRFVAYRKGWTPPDQKLPDIIEFLTRFGREETEGQKLLKTISRRPKRK